MRALQHFNSGRTSGIKVLQRSHSLVAKYGGVVVSHTTSNPAISDVKRGKKKNGLKLRVSLFGVQ